jgi:hypothetical protein
VLAKVASLSAKIKKDEKYMPTKKAAKSAKANPAHILLTNWWESRIRQGLQAIAKTDTIISNS